MRSKSIPIFATGNDISPLLRRLEEAHPVKYVRTGLFESPTRPEYHAHTELPDLGVARTGSQATEPTYLIVPAELPVAVREVPQKKGGVLYAIDQLRNPASVALRVGGRFGDDVIVAGQVGTVSDDPRSIAVYRALAGAVQKAFETIGAYRVGPEAARSLDAGARLTAVVSGSREYDLRR